LSDIHQELSLSTSIHKISNRSLTCTQHHEDYYGWMIEWQGIFSIWRQISGSTNHYSRDSTCDRTRVNWAFC